MPHAKPRRRRRCRLGHFNAAEVLESRVLLSATSPVNTLDAQVRPDAINGSYNRVVSGDFNNEEIDDGFYWNPLTGANRFIDVGFTSNDIVTNPVSPGAINGNDFTEVIVGNFMESFNAETTGEELFFWNPVTGRNRIVSVDSGQIFTNVIDPRSINGNDFTVAQAGRFIDNDGLSELFFWNPATGRNRMIQLEAILISDQPRFLREQTNGIDPKAINGNDFTEIVVGELDGFSFDEMFFWNPVSGKNRVIVLATGDANSPVNVIAEETDAVDPAAINGAVYTNLVIGDFDNDGNDDLFFWQDRSGTNRVVFNEDPLDLEFRIETNCVNPISVNGDFETMVTIRFDSSSDAVFFWDIQGGKNRTALF